MLRVRTSLLGLGLLGSSLFLAGCFSPPPPPTCDPNYTGCVPIDSDVDCLGGTGNGPSYVAGPVQVIGIDVYGLDDDHDGVGCEL